MEGSTPVFCDCIECAEVIRRGAVVARMKEEFVEFRLAAFIDKDDERDQHARVGERLNLLIKARDGGFMKTVGAALPLMGDGLGGFAQIKKVSEITVQGGVFDPQSERIIDHLDLEPFLACGDRVGIAHSFPRR